MNGVDDVGGFKATHGEKQLHQVVLAVNSDTATDGNDWALVFPSNRPDCTLEEECLKVSGHINLLPLHKESLLHEQYTKLMLFQCNELEVPLRTSRCSCSPCRRN